MTGAEALLLLDGVGPARARALRDAGVDSLGKLREALRSGALRRLDGFGPGVEDRLRRSLAAQAEIAGRVTLDRADRAADEMAALLGGAGIDFRVAGELRRRCETVAAVDFACAAEPAALLDLAERECLVDRPGERGGRSGAEGVVGRARDGGHPVRADEDARARSPIPNPLIFSLHGVSMRLAAVPGEILEAAAHHLTGPAAYLDALSERAAGLGMRLAPTGLSGAPDATEAGIYAGLGLPWIAPELREDAATVERAERGLPDLVTGADVRGDLHVHTTWSDGADTVRGMARAAAERGWEYVAITDHSVSVRVAGGLDAAAVRAQGEEIGRVQGEFAGLRILRGCEVDVLADGSLDLPDEVLAELDVVIASVHSSFGMTRARMTDRIVAAMENPFVHVLGHPTGRKLGRRGPYPVDMEEVLRAAARLGVAVEVNGHPLRLDLDHRWLRRCGELGVLVSVGSDAHSAARLGNIRYGVEQARRGWLPASRIVNAAPLAQLLDWTRRRRG